MAEEWKDRQGPEGVRAPDGARAPSLTDPRTISPIRLAPQEFYVEINRDGNGWPQPIPENADVLELVAESIATKIRHDDPSDEEFRFATFSVSGTVRQMTVHDSLERGREVDMVEVEFKVQGFELYTARQKMVIEKEG